MAEAAPWHHSLVMMAKRRDGRREAIVVGYTYLA